MNCIDCGKKLSKPKYKRCLRCRGINCRGKNLVDRICTVCKKKFSIWPSSLNKGLNSGLFCSKSCASRISEWTPERRNKFSEGQRGSKNPQWKGDGVGYTGLHSWVRSVLGKPTFCVF